MGTMVERPDGSNKIGVAPGAKWIAARVFDALGNTTDNILLEAADWMLAPGGDLMQHQMVTIHGVDWTESTTGTDAVNNYINAEIFPVFSQVTRDQENQHHGRFHCMPTNYPESLAVAATDRNDLRASFQS